MASLTVTITPTPSGIAAHIDTLVDDLPRLVREAIVETGLQVADGLREATPLGIGRTGGHLADSYVTATTNDALVEVATEQGLKYDWVTQGTTTPILPVIKKALYWPELGHPIAWVHGQTPNDFGASVLDNAVQYLEEQLPRFMEQVTALLDF